MAKVAPFTFKPFSRKQKQILTWWLPESGVSDREGIIADGSIRSGKTVCMSLSFVMWATETFNGYNFAICGKTIGSVRRNVINFLKQILVTRGYTVEDHRADQYLEISRRGRSNRFYLFGGRDERSQDLVQGITLAGVLLDEVALMPKSFVDQACARCSVDGSKLWFNCNPGGPLHWFKVEWLDKCEERNMLHLHFGLDDNLSLSQQIKDRYRAMFTGVFYKRYILGLWVAAEGLIYALYEDALEDRYAPQDAEGVPLAASEYCISIDYGTMNAFAVCLWAREGQTWHMTDEYRYSGRDTGKQKTDEDYAEDLVKFVEDRIPTAAWPQITAEGGLQTIIDPSAASFIATLRRRQGFRIRKADNDVLDGIRDTATCLQSGKIRIARTCTEAIKEFSGYVWDDKSEKEDKPVKVNDHLMDSIRYMVRTKRLVKPVEDYKSPFRRRV